MGVTERNAPRCAAWCRKLDNRMDITLHLGAHRTASTCFQYYLRENAAALTAKGIGVWGPWRTREGVLSGVMRVASAGKSRGFQHKRARGRIGLALHRAEAKGLQRIVVSDENMIGALRCNLRDSKLYAAMGERMAWFDLAFDGRVSRVMLAIRAQDAYWGSVFACAVGRGHRVPGMDDLDRLVTARRGWRDVIGDLACAMPGAELLVLPHEQFGGLPEQKLSAITGLDNPPMAAAREWKNRAPSLAQLRQILKDRGDDPRVLPQGEGRWHPFDEAQTMALREAYADDLFWLRTGADGLATLIEETGIPLTGKTPQSAQTTRGQENNGIEHRRLA